MAAYNVKKADLPPDHPSIDLTERFPLDRQLRAAGWRIAGRVSGQEPVWENRRERIVQSRIVVETLEDGKVLTTILPEPKRGKK